MNEVHSPLSDVQPELVQLLAVEKIVALYKRNIHMDVSKNFGNYRKIGLYKCSESGLLFFSPTTPGDGRFYEDLQANSWYYQGDKSEWQYAQAYTRQKSILEVGCGVGKFAAYAQAAAYKGLELNENAARIARGNGLDVSNELLSDHAIERSGYYDVVCSFQVLEHVTDVKKFIVDVITLCRPGGTIILSVPNDDSFVGIACDNYLNMPPHHLTRWPKKSLQFVGNMFGLEIIDLHEDEFDHIHSEWYARILAGYLLRAIINRPPTPLVSGGLVDRVLDKLGRLVGKRLASMQHFDHVFPKGHSITAVYKRG